MYQCHVHRVNSASLTMNARSEIKADASARKTSNHLREAEVCLPALTADNRTKWAEARELHFSEGINRRSLDTIERALIWLALDDSATDVLDWTGRGRAIMCGNRCVCTRVMHTAPTVVASLHSDNLHGHLHQLL